MTGAQIRVAAISSPARTVRVAVVRLPSADLFLATAWRGELTNTEPDEHLAVAWSPADALPLPMFPTSHAALTLHLSGGRGFSTHGWDGEPFDPRTLVGA